MGYIARKEETGELFYSKGANKIADLLKINPTTVTRNATKEFSKKEYNGYRFTKCTEIANMERGIPFKKGNTVFKDFNSY